MSVLQRTVAVLSLSVVPVICIGADNISFTGTLIETPLCTVSNQNKRIDVAFDTLVINKIDGENYRKVIPYQVSCPNATQSMSWRMKLTIKGFADVDPSILKTSVPNLGIKILLNGTPMTINQSIPIDVFGTTPLPELIAVPVKKAGAALPGIDFTATALLIAELY